MFVGNLSYTATERDIEALFSEVGDIVEVFVPTDRLTGRPRGFAFVEYREEDAANAAVERFNEAELNGRNLRVNLAEERAPQSRGFMDPGGGPPPGRRGKKGRPAKPKGSRRGLRAKKRSL